MNNPLKYTCLFGGGAIRGLAYAGTIRALEELGVEYDIIGGSSVGSIIASLVAVGYKSYEIENFFMKVNFDLFKDIHLGFRKSFAISKGEIFLDWLNELLRSKIDGITGKNIIFRDIQNKLVIITTDIKHFCPKEFSKSETPDFEVAKAIKISSSMPGFMAPYEYEDAELVDGDLLKASPMWKLSEQFENSESRILEFRLEGDYNKDEKNPISYINTVYSCITDAATKFVTDTFGQNDKYDYITINTGDIFFADFNLDKNSRRELINLGYEQTMKYFTEKLPEKKENLINIYSKLSKFLKKSKKGLQSKNVEEAQWWLGDIFTLICENKELIDPNIYRQIVDLKDNISKNISTILFLHTYFKNSKELEEQYDYVITNLDAKVVELKLYLRKIKPVLIEEAEEDNPDEAKVIENKEE
jgi:NTE family protein